MFARQTDKMQPPAKILHVTVIPVVKFIPVVRVVAPFFNGVRTVAPNSQADCPTANCRNAGPSCVVDSGDLKSFHRSLVCCLRLAALRRQSQFCFCFARLFLAHAALRRLCLAAHAAQWCLVFRGLPQVRHLPDAACAWLHFCCRVMGYLLRHTAERH